MACSSELVLGVAWDGPAMVRTDDLGRRVSGGGRAWLSARGAVAAVSVAGRRAGRAGTVARAWRFWRTRSATSTRPSENCVWTCLRRTWAPLLHRGVASPWTTSAGRLFDAAATLILPPDATRDGVAQFEGQLAMLLEAACDDTTAAETYPFPLTTTSEGLLELDWRPLWKAIVEERRAAGAGRHRGAAHATLAGGICELAARFPALPVVLGGGVFQNRRLLERVHDRFTAARGGSACPAPCRRMTADSRPASWSSRWPRIPHRSPEGTPR